MNDEQITLQLPPDTRIEWSYPEPRPGWRGVFDKIAGPGQTRVELRLFATCTVVSVIVLVLAERSGALGVDWSLAQLLVACFLALNVGFVCIIPTGASKRWYHRRGPMRGGALALVFADGLFQLVLVNAVFAWGDWRYLAYLGVYFVAAGLTIPRLPLYLCRPLALLSCFGGIVLALYLVPSIAGLEWFPAVFFLKYLVAHLPREEPYRPAS